MTTDADTWADHFIPGGTDIDEDEWQALVDEIHYRKALNKCFDLLGRRGHSVAELRRKLLADVDETAADRAIARVQELGYLNDEEYARSLLRHLTENKHMSSSFIRQEMRKRGISGEMIALVMSETEIDNVGSIELLIVRKYRSKLAGENGRDKVIAALMRKGFTYADIKAALRNLEVEDDAF